MPAGWFRRGGATSSSRPLALVAVLAAALLRARNSSSSSKTKNKSKSEGSIWRALGMESTGLYAGAAVLVVLATVCHQYRDYLLLALEYFASQWGLSWPASDALPSSTAEEDLSDMPPLLDADADADASHEDDEQDDALEKDAKARSAVKPAAVTVAAPRLTAKARRLKDTRKRRRKVAASMLQASGAPERAVATSTTSTSEVKKGAAGSSYRLWSPADDDEARGVKQDQGGDAASGAVVFDPCVGLVPASLAQQWQAQSRALEVGKDKKKKANGPSRALPAVRNVAPNHLPRLSQAAEEGQRDECPKFVVHHYDPTTTTSVQCK